MRYSAGSICGLGSLIPDTWIKSLVSTDPASFPNIRTLLVLGSTLRAKSAEA